MMTNLISKSVKPLVATLAVALFAGAAQAGDKTNPALHDWAVEASKSVDAVMTYPRIALMRGDEGNVRFTVTVDREGNVLDAVQTERPFSNGISTAARKVIQKADFPALPAAYGKQKMTFAVQLVYAVVNSEREAQALQRQGYVSSQQLASSGAPMTASIQILDDAE